MVKEDLPPLQFDGKFEGYGYYDPRAFWDKVRRVQSDRDLRRSPPVPRNKTEPGKDRSPT